MGSTIVQVSRTAAKTNETWMDTSQRQISEVTRRNIFDQIVLELLPWSGRLDEPDFLSRLYNLRAMKSTDYRFADAYRDIWQHRVNNWDWEPDWVFTDSRFNLLHCPDDAFLRFLCETIHPVVQSDERIVTRLLEIFDTHLAADGFQIVETTRVSGRPVFAARETVAPLPALTAAKEITQGLTADYLNQQITRMESAIHADPALAIGTAKELIETCCKTILYERSKPVDDNWHIPRLVRATLEELQLVPESIPKDDATRQSVRRTLGNLAQLAQGAAELRNLYGTGHGKDAASPIPPPHHARLAVGAASTLVVFLFETHGSTVNDSQD